MSDLSFLEKNKLEKLLGMETGYVLDFSNRAFALFITESVGKAIYDVQYENYGGSKANRLRAFWTKEPNHVVGKLMTDILDYSLGRNLERVDDGLFEKCCRIAQRLLQGATVQEIDAISPNAGGRNFEILAKAVREAIDKNEPEYALDRLHTFVVKYIRALCDKHGISVERDKPLHSLFGEYVKNLKQQGLIESDMTERILKSSISTMDAFNRVRNDQSFAHDNPVLNYNESLLIFNHIASSIRFIGALENRTDGLEQTRNEVSEVTNDIPF